MHQTTSPRPPPASCILEAAAHEAARRGERAVDPLHVLVAVAVTHAALVPEALRPELGTVAGRLGSRATPEDGKALPHTKALTTVLRRLGKGAWDVEDLVRELLRRPGRRLKALIDRAGASQSSPSGVESEVSPYGTLREYLEETAVEWAQRLVAAREVSPVRRRKTEDRGPLLCGRVGYESVGRRRRRRGRVTDLAQLRGPLTESLRGLDALDCEIVEALAVEDLYGVSADCDLTAQRLASALDPDGYPRNLRQVIDAVDRLVLGGVVERVDVELLPPHRRPLRLGDDAEDALRLALETDRLGPADRRALRHELDMWGKVRSAMDNLYLNEAVATGVMVGAVVALAWFVARPAVGLVAGTLFLGIVYLLWRGGVQDVEATGLAVMETVRRHAGLSIGALCGLVLTGVAIRGSSRVRST